MKLEFVDERLVLHIEHVVIFYSLLQFPDGRAPEEVVLDAVPQTPSSIFDILVADVISEDDADVVRG